MSDSESGDGMEELQAILDEYAENKNPSKAEKPDETAKKEQQPVEWIKSEEEIRLEKLIFGDKEGLLENLKKSSSKPDEDAEKSQAKKRKPAWRDDDDEDLKLADVHKNSLEEDKTYKEFLKRRFQRVVATPDWADLDRKEEVDSDEEILQTVGFLGKSKSEALPPQEIKFKKLKDMNRATKSEGSINSIQFHPNSTVAMVSGYKGIATLYSIDGRNNEKLHNIRFNKFPIMCAKILQSGTEAMFSSFKGHYYSYDLMQAKEKRHGLPSHLKKITNFELSPDAKYFVANGEFGQLHLFDLKSKEFIHTFKQEDDCQTVKFSIDSTKIITSSVGSSVNIYDMRQQRVMHTFLDDGCIHGQSLAISPDGRLLATGSKEGAVNIYEYQQVFASKAPQPEKTLLNLTTCITNLNFNHTSEVLAMCSDVVSSAVRLVHFPTGTVFANFPGIKAGFRSIRVMEFSPSSGFLALGAKEGKAPLYRLKHFSNY